MGDGYEEKVIPNKELLSQQEIMEREMIRGLSRQRAEYVYYILKAARESGIDFHDFARKGLIDLGVLRAERGMNGQTFENVRQFFDALAPEKMRRAFGMEGEYVDDYLKVHVSYCPLVDAWERLDLPQEEIRDLCEVFMSGDMQSYCSMPGLHCEWIHSLAHGDGECMFVYSMTDEPDGDVDPTVATVPKRDRPCEAGERKGKLCE